MSATARTPVHRIQRISPPPVELTDRDERILALIVDGANSIEIANALDLTPGTMRVYLSYLYKRLGVSNMTAAAVWALQREIADLRKQLKAAQRVRA